MRTVLRRLFTPITPGARRAVVVLFALSFALAGVSMTFTAWQVRSNDRKFCDVVAAAAVPVARPADPAEDPARERQWEWYRRYAALGRSLGC